MSTWIADHSAAVLDFQDLTPHITYLEEYSYAVASGGFADIFRAKYRGKDVAVKVIRSRSSDEEKVQTWFTKVKREMSVWSMLDHDNILPFLGFCDFQGAPIMPRNSLASMCPVSPWMKNGSAPRYIRDNPHVDRVALLLGIAKGLSYLHSRKIIHGDLKGENVLITDKGTPVLADFGLAAFDDIDYTLMSSSTGGVKGTSRWVAPELLRGGDTASKVSRGSDIWALGCIFLEVVALMKPYAAYKNDLPILFAIMRHRLPHESLSTSTRVLYKQENISSDLVEEVEPPPPAFARHPGLWDLCLKCWDFEPTSRPKCSDISDFIAQLQSTRVPSTPLDSSIAYEPPLLSTPETSNKSIPPLDELFKEFTDLKIDVIYPENPHEALRSFRYAEIYKGQFKGSWVALKVVEVGHWSGVHEKVLLKVSFAPHSTWIILIVSDDLLENFPRDEYVVKVEAR
ncbi:kinase-like protein [Sistotremastrum suecicum HHB10207 ss-3]|uniref:Kinase-like protein n=1 Tax=Sistotremastrum suecicum HHB10207 ss-3 TaxID=1314776 RepID=A0A166CTM6_9AGAM|nr:kinase-like protein [Sistotremastrum suecicum HHB10207 ss-3]